MNSQSNQQPNHQQTSAAQYQWFETALGRYLQHEEQDLFDQAVVDLFGFNALQMGCLQMDLLGNSRIAHRYRSSDYADAAQKADLQCCDDFLPFAEASIDLLLLPHRLEFSERPHQTLREAERVMMPEGHLLISGFNPFSLWGLALGFKNIVSGRCGAKRMAVSQSSTMEAGASRGHSHNPSRIPSNSARRGVHLPRATPHVMIRRGPTVTTALYEPRLLSCVLEPSVTTTHWSGSCTNPA